MADEPVGRAEYNGRVREVDGRFERAEESMERGFARLEKMVGEGFAGIHRRQDLANGRTSKIEATCAERGRACPGIVRAAGQGIVISPKLAVGIVVGVLILAISAVAGRDAVTAFVQGVF